MPLRKANLHEAENILKFYKNVIDSIKDSEFKPRWSDSYPNLEFLKEHIKKEELYIYLNDNDIVSAFILNNQFDNDYSDVKWLTDARLSEISVIHTFAVNSNYAGEGYSRKIVSEIKSIAQNNNQKTLRIDIIDGNNGAQKVFEHLGFKYVDSVELTHYVVGLVNFHLYELVLKK